MRSASALTRGSFCQRCAHTIEAKTSPTQPVIPPRLSKLLFQVDLRFCNPRRGGCGEFAYLRKGICVNSECVRSLWFSRGLNHLLAQTDPSPPIKSLNFLPQGMYYMKASQEAIMGLQSKGSSKDIFI